MVGKELQCSGTKDVNLLCAGFFFKIERTILCV